MNLICDTNIWYNIANNQINVELLKEKEYNLIVNPINILEVISTEKINLDFKIKIIDSMLKHGNEYINQIPDQYLINLWKEGSIAKVVNWKEFLIEYKNKLTYDGNNNSNISNISCWKNENYNSFSKDVTMVLEGFLPNFEEQRKQGKGIHMKKDELQKLINNEMTYMIFETFIATFYKYKLYELNEKEFSKEQYILIFNKFHEDYKKCCQKGKCNIYQLLEFVFPSDATMREKYEKIKVYCNAYPYYIMESLSITQNEPNDLGDFEMLVYINEKNKLFTKEKKWKRIMENANLEEYLFNE